MKSLLTIKAQYSPEFLERLLRVCRHRGFSVESINADMLKTPYNIHISMTVCSHLHIELLSKQIEKLIGVEHVSILQQEQSSKATA